MRLSHLLFEARDLLGSKELQQLFIDIELKYKIKPEQAVALVNQVDPRNKYAKWILQRIEDGSLKPDKKEISEYAEAIRQMEHTNQSNRARGISAINIMQFKTLSDLQNAINLTPIAQKKGYIKDPTKLKGVEFIGKIEGIEAYKVTDPHSLNEMGIGTKWCTRKDYEDGDENPFLTATDCIKDDGFVYVFRENGYPIIQASKNFDMFTDINNKEIKRNFVYNIAKQLGILGETIAFIIPRLSKKFISKLTFSDESILSLIVKNPKVVKYFDNLSDKVQVEATKKGCFKYLRNPSEAAQIQAVSQAAHYIDLIENPSEKVQLALVSNYGICIKDLIEKGIVPSERVKLAAVQENGNVIHWIKNPSEEVQLAAVQQSGYAIQYIENPSERVQLAAVQKHGSAIYWIENPSEELQLAAVQQDGLAIKHIENPSERVQLAAVQQSGSAIQYIENPSENVQLAAVQQDGLAIQFIKNPSENVQLVAVQQNGLAIKHIENPSERVKAAARANGWNGWYSYTLK